MRPTIEACRRCAGLLQKDAGFANWELTKAEKSFIVKGLWDTKFDRGSMQIFFDHPLG